MHSMGAIIEGGCLAQTNGQPHRTISYGIVWLVRRNQVASF